MIRRLFSFFILGVITISLTLIYENRIGTFPPPGKFLDPFGGYWQNAEKPLPEFPDKLIFPALKEDVRIVYDDRLIPHIFAMNEHDLYFMQGYVTAQHRLWQMDMQSRAAAGRLSEIVGEKALGTDMHSRRTGLPMAAEKSVEKMMNDPRSRAVLIAYSAGINALIGSLKPSELPLEYKMLDFKPEHWTPLKSALLLKYMANILTTNENDFENTNAVNLFGYDVFEHLFPNMPDTLLDPVIPAGTKFKKAFLIPKNTGSEMSASKTDYKSPHEKSAYFSDKEDPFQKQDPGLGSNNWAISGSRTLSGKPILCNDPHLTLNLPSIWFEIQLNAPGINVYGVSIPGAPCILSGFNDSIAWGITNAAQDVRDWYAIQFKGKNRNEYLSDRKWLPTKKQFEVYSIRGKNPVYDTLVYTDLGPVPYDKKFNKGKETIDKALRWTAHEAGNELLTFYLLNKGKSFSDYQSALQHYACPGQNFVFASSSGDIAIKHQGLFVNRYKNQGRFVMDGSRSETHWSGFIPDSALPEILNPPRGWVSSANQHPTDSAWPYYYCGNFEYFRNRRINEYLRKLKSASVKDMMNLQNDNYNLYASESLPILMKNMKFKLSEKENKILKELQNWSFLNEPEMSAPVYFEEWWKEFKKLLWDEFSVKDQLISAPGSFQTILFLKRNPIPQFIDNSKTSVKENLEIITLTSFQNAMRTIEDWKKLNPDKSLNWANYKNTTILHLSQQNAFSYDHISIGGNSGIVNAASNRNGPSWRMVVSPGLKSEAYGIYPGGQSGNPGSYFYSNFIPDWSKGRYYPLLFLKSDEKNQRILFRQTAVRP